MEISSVNLHKGFVQPEKAMECLNKAVDNIQLCSRNLHNDERCRVDGCVFVAVPCFTIKDKLQRVFAAPKDTLVTEIAKSEKLMTN